MEKMERKELIRWIYLYLFSAIGLVVAIIGAVRLVDLGLKVFVFQEAERYYYPEPIRSPAPEGKDVEQPTEEELERQRQEQIKAEEINRASQRQREASGAISMLAIGIPLYFYHWRTIQKDKRS